MSGDSGEKITLNGGLARKNKHRTIAFLNGGLANSIKE
jgi:flagellar biosynthesis regulator FlbT